MTCASMRGHGCSMMLNLWLLMLTLIPVHGVTTSSQDSTFLMQCTTPSVVIANNEAKDYVVHVAHDGAALNDAGYKVRAELAASCSTRCTLPLNSPYIEAPVENGIAVLRSLRLSVGSRGPDASTTTCDVLFTLIYSENNETLCELPYAVLVDVEVYDILVQEPLRIMNAVATDFDFLVLKGGMPLSVEGATLHMTIDNTDERCRYEGVEALPTLSISNGSAHHPPVRIVYGANVLACSLVFVINDPVTRRPSQTVQRTIPTVSMKVTLAEPLAILPDVPLDFTVAVVFDGVLQVGTGYAITLTWSRHEDPACESVHLPSTALPLVSGRITFPDVIVRTADAVTHCHFDVTLIHIASQTLVHSVRTSTPVRSSHYHMHFDDRNGIVSGISNTLRIRVLSQDSDFTAIPGLKVSLSVDSNATPRCDMALNDSEVAVQADGTATFPSVHVHFPHNVYWCSFVATLYVTLSSVMLTQSLTKFVNIYHMTLMSPTEIRNGASQTYSVAVTQNGHALSSPDIRLHMAVAEESSSVCAFTQEPSAVVLTDAAGRAFFHDVTLRWTEYVAWCRVRVVLRNGAEPVDIASQYLIINTSSDRLPTYKMGFVTDVSFLNHEVKDVEVWVVQDGVHAGKQLRLRLSTRDEALTNPMLCEFRQQDLYPIHALVSEHGIAMFPRLSVQFSESAHTCPVNLTLMDDESSVVLATTSRVLHRVDITVRLLAAPSQRIHTKPEEPIRVELAVKENGLPLARSGYWVHFEITNLGPEVACNFSQAPPSPAPVLISGTAKPEPFRIECTTNSGIQARADKPLCMLQVSLEDAASNVLESTCFRVDSQSLDIHRVHTGSQGRVLFHALVGVGVATSVVLSLMYLWHNKNRTRTDCMDDVCM